MRRWRLPSAKRLRLPSSASGDETRSSDETSEVLRASGWPLWFCMAGRPGRGLRAQTSTEGPRQGVYQPSGIQFFRDVQIANSLMLVLVRGL